MEACEETQGILEAGIRGTEGVRQAQGPAEVHHHNQCLGCVEVHLHSRVLLLSDHHSCRRTLLELILRKLP